MDLNIYRRISIKKKKIKEKIFCPQKDKFVNIIINLQAIKILVAFFGKQERKISMNIRGKNIIFGIL